MTAISQTSPFANISLPATAPRTGPRAGFRYVDYQAESRQADIVVTTREGDRVSISQEVTAQQGRNVSQNAAGSEMEMRAANGEAFSLAVKGDLSDQELNDLAGLVNDLAGIAADFFSGDVAGAMSGVMDGLDMGSSLFSVAASFTRTTVSAVAAGGGHPLPAGFPPPDAGRRFADLGLDDVRKTMADNLQAQWEQFLEHLDRDQDGASTRGKQPPAPEPAPAPAAGAGKSMLARAMETIGRHPRLAPHLPAAADKAIADAGAATGTDHRQVNALKDDFYKQLQSWIG